MRVLLAATASYFPPRGGSTRSNLVWLRQLAAAGHACRVLCSDAERNTGADAERAEQGLVSANDGGVDIRPVPDLARKRGVLTEAIADFRPDWILVSSEDLAHSLLREAASLAPASVVFLAHTPQFMPFGPEAWNPDAKAAELLRKVAGVVVIGQAMAEYVKAHLGVAATVIHPPIYPAPERRARVDGSVLMVNPCKVKGIDIFVGLAERCPEISFSALPGWGTTADDLESLSRLPTVRLLKKVKHIEDVLRNSSILLMPSLWFEGFGLIAMEAMASGLPVLASANRGIEAKLGTAFEVGVEPIQRYRTELFDDRHMPVPEVPAQPIGAWVEALRRLRVENEWKTASEQAFAAASAFLRQLDASQLERYLAGLKPDRLKPAQRLQLIAKLRERSGA